jgi:hypothetical protein
LIGGELAGGQPLIRRRKVDSEGTSFMPSDSRKWVSPL